ncbi:Hypothetical protein PP7435_CHR4-0910 [Komagataella phaffii CBS 7435]|uniref:Uncharacterized protein n=1 Tax=Komagataella phaffii (strain ATCC 76273 / CBS 7435 / CECT 11047 / NRRL Y-11430 / Wegner 21-1) TaxID=981350 RepID=F2R083_KOMPC|nr:Hypothetical protein BQ9382_C4-4765 [Komagataella phaffii CBS 7435]CCA41061.1 Hypothetical protein PP7435_CHR4-0910 [Komagataella phaffii CBS 7435]
MTVEAMNKTDLKSNSVISTVIEQDEDDSSLAPLAIDEIAEGIEVITIEEEASSPESSKAEEDQKQNPLKRGNSRFKHFYFKREHQKENQPVEKEKVLREPSSRLSLLRNHKNKPKETSDDAQLKILITKRRHYQAKRYLQLKNNHGEKEQPVKDQVKKEITAETEPQSEKPHNP